MRTSDVKPTRTTGFDHLISSARYSLRGLRRLSGESAFRQELGVSAILVIAMGVAGVGFVPFALAVGMLLLVIAAEALNTAIEEVVDYVSPDFSLAAKHAKDLGSLAVALVLVAAYGFCIAVIAVAILGD